MPVPDWGRAYDIAFSMACLYNLRVSFFLMAYLNQTLGSRNVDFIEFVLDTVGSLPDQFPSLDEAISHVRNNRQLILDNVSSVSPVAGGDGVSLTPHEAMTFLLLNRMDETYTELRNLAERFCEENKLATSATILDEVIEYQKSRVPVFNPPQTIYNFETNVPYFFECIINGKVAPQIAMSPTTIEVKHKPHSYKTETEFNLRRTSGGYTLSVADALIQTGDSPQTESTDVPLARNVNMSPF
jgi:hypothetical protein